jgi:uroporphyrin-III C-methyltransferase/precorrin-2 dehydrogenase/sirohydrochlorin ferrochelatase
MHSLPIFVRLAGRPVIVLGKGEAAAAKRLLIARAGARPCGEEEEAAAALAIVATDDEAEAVMAVARLKARGLLVNAVDRPALCDFTLPAIVDRDPVLIAIGTGGASAGLAKALRQRFEALMPQSIGALATALHAARSAIRARWPEGGERRRAIDRALEPGGPLDPLGVADPAAVARWAAAGGDGPEGGTGAVLRRIALRSADPDDLTLRQARWLAGADRIYHRRDVPPAILARARADAARIACDIVPGDPAPGLSIDLCWEPDRSPPEPR